MMAIAMLNNVNALRKEGMMNWRDHFDFKFDARDFINSAYEYQGTSPAEMLQVVGRYIHQTKRIPITVTWPTDERGLQLLGRAYDIATGKSVKVWDGGKAKLCPNAQAHACNCIAGLCTNKEKVSEVVDEQQVRGSTNLNIKQQVKKAVVGEKGREIKIDKDGNAVLEHADTFHFSMDMGNGPDVHASGVWDKAIKNMKKKTSFHFGGPIYAEDIDQGSGAVNEEERRKANEESRYTFRSGGANYGKSYAAQEAERLKELRIRMAFEQMQKDNDEILRNWAKDIDQGS